MLAELRDVFFKYAPWIILVPAGLVVARLKRAPELKALLCYLIIAVLTQVLSLVFWYNSVNNMPILHVYTILEFLVLFWFYLLAFRGAISKPVFLVVSMLFVGFSLVDSAYIESVFIFNAISRSVEALIFIFLSVLWLVHQISIEEKPDRSGVNYIIAGLFIYYSGSVVLFSFSNDINRMAFSLSLNIWSLHTLLLVIMYLTMTVGLIKYKSA